MLDTAKYCSTLIEQILSSWHHCSLRSLLSREKLPTRGWHRIKPPLVMQISRNGETLFMVGNTIAFPLDKPANRLCWPQHIHPPPSEFSATYLSIQCVLAISSREVSGVVVNGQDYDIIESKWNLNSLTMMWQSSILATTPWELLSNDLLLNVCFWFLSGAPYIRPRVKLN